MQAFSPILAFERLALRIPSAAVSAWSTRRGLAAENEMLREKVAEMSRDMIALRVLKDENSRLRALLDFKESASQALLPAQVIGRDTQQWNSSVIIDKGGRDGVRNNMAVISDRGLVGKIIECAPSTSRVLLILSAQSRLGGIVERTREMGVVEGTSYTACRLIYLPRQTSTARGDRVLTSGMGGVYPKGLMIGVCAGIYEDGNGLYSCADLAPATDFARLEEVFVLMQRPGEGDSIR